MHSLQQSDVNGTVGRNLAHRLASGAVVILDGGTGSELRRRGVALGAGAWSAAANRSQGSLLTTIHRDYIRAGADVITANTFAGTRFVLEAAGLDERFADINRQAIDAAQRARVAEGRPDVAVAASLSCLPPRFDAAAYPDAQAELAAYRELATLFAESGADLILLEMMEEPVHARRAAQAACESGLHVWLGVSCRALAQPPCADTLVGYDFPDIPLKNTLDALLGFDFALCAVMHSPRDAVVPALRLLRSRLPGPFGAWPEQADTPDPDDYARSALDWARDGAQVIGGCCGTTPADIAALHRVRQDLQAALDGGDPDDPGGTASPVLPTATGDADR